MNEKSLEEVLCDVRSMAPYVMCSREEMKDRTRTFEISRFERDDDHDETDDNRGSSSLQRMVQKTKHRTSKKADARRVVQKYRRSAAGCVFTYPQRTLADLELTVHYLLLELFPSHVHDNAFHVVGFVHDRLRAVQVDLSRIGRHNCIRNGIIMMSRMIRYYALSGYLLCDDDVGKDSLEWKLHNQQLSACLSLFRISLEVLASNDDIDILTDAILLQEIDESLSFSLLHSICSAVSLHHFDDYNSTFLHATLEIREIVQLISSLLPRSLAKCNYGTTRVSLSGTVLDLFPKVRWSIRLIVLIQDRNYVRVIRVLTEGDERWNVVLRAIVAPKLLPLLRFSALEIWNCSMMKRGKYPLNEVSIKIR